MPILLPRTDRILRLLAVGTLATTSGAIFFPVASAPGIDPHGDGGRLFKETVFTGVMALFMLFAHRADAWALWHRLPPDSALSAKRAG